MGIFDFFKKKDADGNEAEMALKESAEEKESDDQPAEDLADGAGQNPDETGADTAEAAGGPTEEVPGESTAEEMGESAAESGAEPMEGPVKLTPEQIAERKAKQEELTKKRDEDGKVLAYLIDRHHEMKNAESFKTVLQSLTTCWLWVPMIMQLSKEDAAAIQAARQSGRKVTPKDRVRLVPAMLKSRDGKMIYSTFSNREEIPADLQKKFVWVQMQSGQCARNVVANSGIEAMVVNPNSKSLLLKRDLLEKIVKPLNESTTRNAQTSDTDNPAKEPDTTGYTS